MKPLQTYTAPGITVTFDPQVCVHSAVCLAALPAVFDVRRRRWVAPEAAAAADVAAAIDRCPSGALKYVMTDAVTTAPTVDAARDSAASEAGARIQASLNGPLLLQGDYELLDEAGAPIPRSGRLALCRCGGTLVLRPGTAGLQEKVIPIDALFHKIVMIRNKLRTLEQQVNASDLPDDAKVKLQSYITGCYGSLTTFNVLFAEEEDQFSGAGTD